MEIDFEDFKKIKIKIGKIKEVEKVEGSDKLLRLIVSFGDEKRQILSGIAKFFDNEKDLVGKQMPFLINIKTRNIMGLESQGMLVAVGDGDKEFTPLVPEEEVSDGSSVV